MTAAKSDRADAIEAALARRDAWDAMTARGWSEEEILAVCDRLDAANTTPTPKYSTKRGCGYDSSNFDTLLRSGHAGYVRHRARRETPCRRCWALERAYQTATHMARVAA